NGWAGSTASGVRTGKTWPKKNSSTRARSSALSSSTATFEIDSASRRGPMSSLSRAACRLISSWARTPMACMTCAGIRPVTLGTARPVLMRRLSPATRTMKNSSRLVAKIDRNRTRSSSGICGSEARSRTRSLNASQLSSRSRKRSAGSGRPSSSPAAAMSYKGLLLPARRHRRVGHVRDRDMESQPLVQVERRGVVRLDVEFDDPGPGREHPPHALDRQRPAHALGVDVRIDADDIDLAEAALGLRVRELDLVEAHDLAFAFGGDGRLGVEVVCGDDRVDVGPVLRALLRMPVEGGVVDRQPAVLVAGGEGADLYALGRSSRRQVVGAEVRIGAHLIEHAVAAESVLVRQAGRGR